MKLIFAIIFGAAIFVALSPKSKSDRIEISTVIQEANHPDSPALTETEERLAGAYERAVAKYGREDVLRAMARLSRK